MLRVVLLTSEYSMEKYLQMMQGNIWISTNLLGFAQSMTLVLRFQTRPSFGRAIFAHGSSSELISNSQFKGLKVILADDDGDCDKETA